MNVRKLVVVVMFFIVVSFLTAIDFDLEAYRTDVFKYETGVFRGNKPIPNRLSRPDWEVAYYPISIMGSFYDYFPGGYSSYPLVLQPSPVGMYDGGGLYALFHSTPVSGGTRRGYYAYIDEGFVASSSLINLAGATAEGFLAVDLDRQSGDPFVSWHSASSVDEDILQIHLTYDQYSLIGVPGLWGNPYTVIDNVQLEERYIWPTVKVGESPYPGMRRVYVLGSNSGPVGPTTQGNNGYLAFADYVDVTDLAVYDEQDWTHYEVPYMRDWAMEDVKPYFDFSVTDEGKVIIAGTLFDWGAYSDDNWPGGYSDNDALFVLFNENWGDGSSEDDWVLITQDPNMPVENPDGYFTDDDEEPLENLYVVPFAPRFTITTDLNGDVIFSCTYRLASSQANRLYYNQGYIKFVRFDFSSSEFIVTDIYPRSENPQAQPYVPWDPEGDGEWEYDANGNLILTYSWPVWWWDDADFGFQRENYSRITKTGEKLAIIFQESMKARLINEYGDPDYSSWGDKPETYIFTSADNGVEWDDPIILHANTEAENYFPPFEGMIPSYFYPADSSLEDLGSDWLRLHLLFFNQNDYGSYISGNGPNTGGDLTYYALDIDFTGNTIDVPTITEAGNLLKPNYPNPFNPATTLRFVLPNAGKVKLSIYNVKGQLVKKLVNNHLSSGEHSVVWSGRNDHNVEVGGGVYFYKLTTESNVEVRKMLLMK